MPLNLVSSGDGFPVPVYQVPSGRDDVKDGATDLLSINLASLTFVDRSLENDFSAVRFQLSMPMHIFWFSYVIVVCIVGTADPIFKYAALYSLPGVLIAMVARIVFHYRLEHVPYRNRKLYANIFLAFNLWVWFAWWQGLVQALSGENEHHRSSVAMTVVWQCSLTVYTTFMQFFTLTVSQR